MEGGGQWGLGIYFVGPVGDSTGRFEIVGIVKDGEGMEGRVREVAAHLAAFALGIIEDHGRGRNAAPEGVDTPPPELLTGVGGVFLFPKGDLGPEAGGLEWLDRLASDLANASIGESEGLITNHP